MVDVQRCLSLRDETGAALSDCKKAIEYADNHNKCTALGYLKARGYAVATSGMSFEERVELFSEDTGRKEGEAE